MSNIKVPLSQATNNQLRHYAGVILGIDGIKAGQSDKFLIGKIEAAAPGIAEIEVPENLPNGDITSKAPEIVAAGATGDVETAPDVALSPRDAAHYRFDPVVTVQLGQPYDGSRIKEVMLSVGGQTITIQRGKQVKIPYRFYLSLDQAKEQFYQDTDEIHPQSGMPIKELVERHTIPFQLHGDLPSAAEIAEFHRRTDNVSL